MCTCSKNMVPDMAALNLGSSGKASQAAGSTAFASGRGGMSAEDAALLAMCAAPKAPKPLNGSKPASSVAASGPGGSAPSGPKPLARKPAPTSAPRPLEQSPLLDHAPTVWRNADAVSVSAAFQTSSGPALPRASSGTLQEPLSRKDSEKAPQSESPSEANRQPASSLALKTAAASAPPAAAPTAAAPPTAASSLSTLAARALPAAAPAPPGGPRLGDGQLKSAGTAGMGMNPGEIPAPASRPAVGKSTPEAPLGVRKPQLGGGIHGAGPRPVGRPALLSSSGSGSGLAARALGPSNRAGGGAPLANLNTPGASSDFSFLPVRKNVNEAAAPSKPASASDALKSLLQVSYFPWNTHLYRFGIL